MKIRFYIERVACDASLLDPRERAVFEDELRAALATAIGRSARFPTASPLRSASTPVLRVDLTGSVGSTGLASALGDGISARVLGTRSGGGAVKSPRSRGSP